MAAIQMTLGELRDEMSRVKVAVSRIPLVQSGGNDHNETVNPPADKVLISGESVSDGSPLRRHDFELLHDEIATLAKEHSSLRLAVENALRDKPSATKDQLPNATREKLQGVAESVQEPQGSLRRSPTPPPPPPQLSPGKRVTASGSPDGEGWGVSLSPTTVSVTSPQMPTDDHSSSRDPSLRVPPSTASPAPPKARQTPTHPLHATTSARTGGGRGYGMLNYGALGSATPPVRNSPLPIAIPIFEQRSPPQPRGNSARDTPIGQVSPVVTATATPQPASQRFAVKQSPMSSMNSSPTPDGARRFRAPQPKVTAPKLQEPLQDVHSKQPTPVDDPAAVPMMIKGYNS